MAQQDAAEQIERIRRRAYEIWVSEGHPDGKDMEHWIRAEAEIAGSANSPGTDFPNTANNAESTRDIGAGDRPGSSAKLGGTPSALATGPVHPSLDR